MKSFWVQTKTLFSSLGEIFFGTVAFLFIFNNYCLIMN
jgi:hypothetical protein